MLFGFFNVKSHFKSNRQVYFIAAIIVILGFFAGSVYTNMITEESFLKYSDVLKNYVSNVKDKTVVREIDFGFGSDISNVILIFFWSFFIYGKPFSSFFAFKSGFSLGFYIAFFVKAYSIKGFLVGLSVLFSYFLFTFPTVSIFLAQSFIVNNAIDKGVFSKGGQSGGGLKKLFLPFLCFFVISMLFVWLGNRMGFYVSEKIITLLF